VPAVKAPATRRTASRARHTDANRQAKQQQIIAAAMGVLADGGLAACTARAVADASPLTKSAIHYYFGDIDEIIDRAVSAHLDAMLDNLRRVAAGCDDPRDRLWQVVRAYLATFADKPHAAYLWFEYWIYAGRRGSLDVAESMLARVRALLVELLDAAGHDDPPGAADTLLSWLLGTVVQQQIHPTPLDALRGTLAQVLDLG
jgi:AcrR family transcriptional regulator